MMNPATQEWMQRRVEAIERVYGAYDVLTERGVEISERSTNQQVLCPFHNEKNPSARYYGSTGKEHFHCFGCKAHGSAVSLYAKFENLKFGEALSKLEKRFGIKIPKRPEDAIKEPTTEKNSKYESDAWSDVPRVLIVLEKKLMRLRDKVAMCDFIKFCRVLDVVKWDYEHNGCKPTQPMIDVLIKLRKMMDDSMNAEMVCL
jgi:hypothetical protein